MRLLRPALALFALGLGIIGCGRSGSSGSKEGRPDKDPGDMPFQAAFRVPGMS